MTGRHPQTIRKALKRLEEMGMAKVEPKTWPRRWAIQTRDLEAVASAMGPTPLSAAVGPRRRGTRVHRPAWGSGKVGEGSMGAPAPDPPSQHKRSYDAS